MRRRARRTAQPLDDMKRPATSKEPVPTGAIHSQLPSLGRLLQNYYHQDAWVEFSNDEEIWSDFLKHEPPSTTASLLVDVGHLLGGGSVGVRDFIRLNADALYFRQSTRYVTWANRLKVWLEGQMSSNKSLERTREG